VRSLTHSLCRVFVRHATRSQVTPSRDAISLRGFSDHFVVGCLLPFRLRPLFVVRGSLFVVRCSLFVVRCSLFVVRCSLFVVQSNESCCGCSLPCCLVILLSCCLVVLLSCCLVVLCRCPLVVVVLGRLSSWVGCRLVWSLVSWVRCRVLS